MLNKYLENKRISILLSFKRTVFIILILSTNLTFASDKSVEAGAAGVVVNLETAINSQKTSPNTPIIEADTQYKAQEASILVDSDKVESSKELELELLRTQNKLIKEYHSSLLSTVYWSGFYPDFTDTSEKVDNGRGGVSCRNEGSIPMSSSEKPLG